MFLTVGDLRMRYSEILAALLGLIIREQKGGDMETTWVASRDRASRTMTETKTLNELGSNAGLDRAAKLRADLDYIRAYLEECHREFVMHEILIDPTGLLVDVTEFISRDDDERANA